MKETKKIDSIIQIVQDIETQVEESIARVTAKRKIVTLNGIDVYSDENLKDGEWYICMKLKDFKIS